MEFLLNFERVYHERTFANGTRKSVIRLVRWNEQRPYVENREFWLAEDKSGWVPRKSKGFTSEDWEILMSKRSEIEADMETAKRMRPAGPLKAKLSDFVLQDPLD